MQTPTYFFEQIEGVLWQDAQGLGISAAPLAPPPSAQPLHTDSLTLRYGVELLKTPLYQMIPGYFETENGAIKTGRAAWDFLWAKWQLYPRADVIGMRSDGKPLHVWLRDLDWGAGVLVLAYPHPQAETALGVVRRLLAPPQAALPELLAQYLPPG